MDVATESVQEAMVSEALVQFKATLQAAIKEVHVDVSAFKQRIEQRIEDLCISNGPLAGAVTKLQEENVQLRAKMEALSRLVEGLAGVNNERSPAEVKGKNVEDSLENGHAQIQSKTQEEQRGLVNSGRSDSSQSSLSTSTFSDPSGSGGSGGWSHATAPASFPSYTRAPPPWRAKRHAEINVSTHSPFLQTVQFKEYLPVDCNKRGIPAWTTVVDLFVQRTATEKRNYRFISGL